jgi:hypothetical protein
MWLDLQAYPVLNADEAEAVENAAVKLLQDFVDQRPPMPDDPELHDMFERDMAKAAENACKLLTALCTKRTSLVERLWSLYLEHHRDPYVKVSPARNARGMAQKCSHVIPWVTIMRIHISDNIHLVTGMSNAALLLNHLAAELSWLCA